MSIIKQHDDLRRIINVVLDIAFYRTVADDGGLGAAAWRELNVEVSKLPEASR